MLGRRKKRRAPGARVRVETVVPRPGEPYTSGVLYELTPTTYAGPWRLPEGTVLEVVSLPKGKS